MAVSAFRSTSRRVGSHPSTSSSRESTETSTSPNKKPLAPPRRSRSVSAYPRRGAEAASATTSTSTSTSTSSDFLNKRDNPLFRTAGSPTENDVMASQKLGGDGDLGRVDSNRTGAAKAKSGSHMDDRRGRTSSRDADIRNRMSGTDRNGIGRSLSRARPRSVSQRPVSRGHFVSSESEVEQDIGAARNCRNRTNTNVLNRMADTIDLEGQCSDSSDQIKGLRKWSSQHPILGSSLDAENLSHMGLTKWQDGDSVGSLSEVEEKTVKAVCEQVKLLQGDPIEQQPPPHSIYETVRSEVRRAVADIQTDLENAVRRSNAAVIASSDVVDIPPDLVNPGAIELVMDIRIEYAKKLEQSQERARKLRADLAVEEHRGQELSRILKEILPDPRTSTSQKNRPTRKASIERRKMSKRLTEEAMAYFDECVSLSAFDSSDFSSQEDPPLKLVGDTKPLSENEGVVGSSLSFSASNTACFYDKQESDRDNLVKDKPEFENGSSNKEHRKFQFSFSSKSSTCSSIQHDIKKYVKIPDSSASEGSRTSQYDAAEYGFRDSMQNMVFDRAAVMVENRVESGNLLLCGGGFSGVCFSPFGSII